MNRRRGAALLVVVPTVGLLAVAADAAWTTAGAGTGSATTTTLLPPSTAHGTGSGSTTVTIAVDAGPTSGVAPSGYRVDRTAPTALTGACAISGASGSCTAAAVGAGANTYRVVSLRGAAPAWTSAASASVTAAPLGVATALVLSFPTTTVAGTPAVAQLRATRADGSTDTSFAAALSWSGTALATSPGGTSATTGSASLVAGVATVPLTLVRAQSGAALTATAGGLSATSTVTVTSGALAALTLPDCASAHNTGNSPGFVTGRVGATDALGNAAVAASGGLSVTMSNSSPTNYALTGAPVLIPAGASTSTATYRVTHTNNANNSTTITTTNAGLTAASCVVSK